MAIITKPMLAGTIKDPATDIKFPCYVSPKLDGIRCLKIDGQIVSRKFKLIPNKYIRQILQDILPEGADGEIMAGKTFQDVSHSVMSEEGEPDFVYNMFDHVGSRLDIPYQERLEWMHLNKFVFGENNPTINIVPAILVNNLEEFLAQEEQFLSQGYEGTIVRSIEGPYKCGRSTLREGYLLKYKHFLDAEAIIIDFEELMHNNNEAEKDAFGRTKRSSKQENLIPAGTLGALIVRMNGLQFKIGTGFDAALKKEIWDNRDKYTGCLVKFKYTDIGAKDLPRFPVFLHFRDLIDT